MKNNRLLQASTLWINFLLLFLISFSNYASPNRISGFHLDEGFYKSTFKFKSVHNLIIMPVVIDGQKLNLIFDTGMNSILVFDRKSISTWKEREKHIIKFSGLGKGSYIKGFRLDDITVKMPNIKGKGISLVVTPNLKFPKQIDGLKIHGVFGYQLLAKFIVQIDYKNEIITLTDPAYFVPSKNITALDLTVFNTKPYVKCSVVINEKEYLLNFLVDTGAEAALILRSSSINFKKSKSGYNHLGVGLAGNLMGNKVIINDFVLGDHHLSKDFEALVPFKDSYPNESPKLIRDGTIGGETLRQFIVTFDYFNNKLYLGLAEKVPSAFRYEQAKRRCIRILRVEACEVDDVLGANLKNPILLF